MVYVSCNKVIYFLLQNLLEHTTVAGFSPVSPVIMVSVGSSKEQSISPSYKMVNYFTFLRKAQFWKIPHLLSDCVFAFFVQSVKTYTRRGRGRCPNPGCSFMYVTRHKPPTCPECGHHLGGKWIPAVSKKNQHTLKPAFGPIIVTVCQNSILFQNHTNILQWEEIDTNGWDELLGLYVSSLSSRFI